MNRIKILGRFASIALLACTVACGGGDGDGLALTQANAQRIATDGVETSDMLESMSELVEDFDDVIENQTALQVLCTSGTMSQNINDVAPLNQISTGDSITFSFNNCTMEDDDGEVTFNGSLSLFVEEVTNGPVEGAFSYRVSFLFNGLTVTVENALLLVDGGFSVQNSSTDGVNLKSVISGSRYSALAQFGPFAIQRTVSDFELDRNINTQTDDYWFSYDAQFSGTGIGGTVYFKTTTDFAGNDDDDPSSGQLEVTSNGDGKITVVALDSNNVQLLVDEDGDGTPEYTINTTWDVLNDEESNGNGSEL